jgi:Tfp pilus assembly protein PilW
MIRAERGQAMVEFALVISLLFLVSVVSMYAVGRQANKTLNSTQNSLTNASLNPPPAPVSLS